MKMIHPWNDVKAEIGAAASKPMVLPFVGAALSIFHPTSLPLGHGLKVAALRGLFPNKSLYRSADNREKPIEEWTAEERAIDNHSPEVVFQGITEGLFDRELLTTFYNRMRAVPYNPLHVLLVDALSQHKIPAVFTTNLDLCLEDASYAHGNPIMPMYDEQQFSETMYATVYQFHGAIGGDSETERQKRKANLNFTLTSMGPSLPRNKHLMLRAAMERYPLLVLGYSASDSDIWYSLDRIFEEVPHARAFWCNKGKPSDHLTRLQARHMSQITVFESDLRPVLQYLAEVWNVSYVASVFDSSPDEFEQRSAMLENWAVGLSADERDMAFGWLLVSVGLFREGTEYLEALAERAKESGTAVVARFLAAKSRRDLSDHFILRKHARYVMKATKDDDLYRHAQACHALGESLSAFESVRFWHLLVRHSGARYLRQSIQEYLAGASDAPDKRVRAASLGYAQMNLGQLYRRTAAYTPGLRPKLVRKSSELLEQAVATFRDVETDLRALPMALAAVRADDKGLSLEKKLNETERAIEYSRNWNQDRGQVGAAYFAKGRLLTKKDLGASEACYRQALDDFRSVGCKAEVARTLIELALVASLEARQLVFETQGSQEWKLGIRALGAIRIVLALVSKELIAGAVVLVLLMAIIDWMALLLFIVAAVFAGVVIVLAAILRGLIQNEA